MLNLLKTNLTSLERATLVRDHRDGHNGDLCSRICALFDTLVKRYGSDTIRDRDDAASYFEQIKSMSVVRNRNGEHIGYVLLNDLMVRSGFDGKENFECIEPQIFLAAINCTSDESYELHYNFVPMSEFESYLID